MRKLIKDKLCLSQVGHLGITAVHNSGTIKKLNSCPYFKKPKPKYTHTDRHTHGCESDGLPGYEAIKTFRRTVGCCLLSNSIHDPSR